MAESNAGFLVENDITHTCKTANGLRALELLIAHVATLCFTPMIPVIPPLLLHKLLVM